MSTSLRQRLSGIIAVLFIFMCFMALSGQYIPSAFADSPEIFAELVKDPEFNAADYPINDKLKTVQVIQVAESTDGELLVYTYQPNADPELHAKSINISRKPEKPDDILNYKLEFVASYGVFFKYIVQDFEILSDPIRYYNIPNIYRPFISGYDTPPAVGSISEIGCAVGKLFMAVTNENTVKYYCKVNEVITVTDKYVGFLRCKNGYDFYGGVSEEMTDAHFVSFSTDRPMDQLKSIRLSYIEVPAQGYFCFTKNCGKGHPYATPFDVSPTDPDGGNWIERNGVVINADQVIKSDDGYDHMFHCPTYEWDTILSSYDFLYDNYDEYNDEDRNAIYDTQWTVCFATTKVWAKTDTVTDVLVWSMGLISTTIGALAGAYEARAQLTQINNVTLLELEYEYNGKTYNMGVVDSKQTGSGDPLNKQTPLELPGYVWAIIAVIAVVLLIVLFVACPQLFTLLVQGLTFIVQKLVEFFVWIAELIASLFHKDGGA